MYQPIVDCSNDDLRLTLTYFAARSNSVRKSEKMNFSETIAACDLKVGRNRQLIEFMKIYEWPRSRNVMVIS